MNPPEAELTVFGADSRECFDQLLGWLQGGDATGMTHGELEDELDQRGRELLRRMLQDHLSLRTATETRLPSVADAGQVTHGTVETGHSRTLASVFGPVQVQRIAYRHRGHANLYPADAVLNLPPERHSHGLRRLSAVESSRGSFEQGPQRSPAPPGSRSANARSRRSPPPPRSTSTTSTPPPAAVSPPPTTCWSSPPTARAS